MANLNEMLSDVPDQGPSAQRDKMVSTSAPASPLVPKPDLSSPYPSRVPPGVAAATVAQAPTPAAPKSAKTPQKAGGSISLNDMLSDVPEKVPQKGDLSRLILGEPIPQQEGIFTKAGERLSEGATKIGRAFQPNSQVQNLWGIPGTGRVGSALGGAVEIASAPFAPIGYAGSRGSSAAVNDQVLDARIARAEKLKREHPEVAGADPDVNALPTLKAQRAIPETERIRQDQERARDLAEQTVGMLTGVAGAASPGWLLRAPGNAVRALRGTEAAGQALKARPEVADIIRTIQEDAAGKTVRPGGGFSVEEVAPKARPAGTEQTLNEAQRILTGGERGAQRTLEAAQASQTGRALDLGEVGKRMAAQRGTYQPSPLNPAPKQIVRELEQTVGKETASQLNPVEQRYIRGLTQTGKATEETAASPLRVVGKAPASGVIAEGKKLMAPHTLSPEAAEAKTYIVRTMAEQAMLRERNRGLLSASEKVVDRLPAASRSEFIRRFESGAAQATPELDSMAQGLRTALDTKWKEVQAVVPGARDTMIENYLPHYYENVDKAREVFQRLGGSVEGAKTFLKDRVFPTYEVAAKAGLKAKDDNIVRISLQRLDDMDQLLSGHKLIQDLERNGLVARVGPKGEIPLGYEKLPGTFPTGGMAAVPHDVAAVFKNWLTPSAIRKAAPKSFEAVRNAGAMTNMVQLGFSAFHATTTAINSVFSQGALGLRQLVSQGVPMAERLRGVGNIATSPLAPVRDLATGLQVRKAVRLGTENPRIAKQVENIVLGGQRTSMQQMDLLSRNGSAIDNTIKAIRRGEYGTAATKGLPAVTEAISAPVMRTWVPNIKQGAFARLAEFEVRRLGPNATEQDIMKALQKAGDSIDNRFGQIVYDNTFWNKTLRDASFLSVRAVGWTFGTLRELGGGITDAAQMARGGEFSNRSAYWVAMVTQTAIMGAVMNKVMTGENPQTLKDYFYPRTGGVDEHGNPERVQLPTYLRDARGWALHPWNTAIGKLHPNIQMIRELAGGTTFGPTGKQEAIYDTHDPYYKIVADVGRYVAHQFRPFSLQSRPTPEGADERSKIGPFVGITPAPREVERSDEEQAAIEAKSPYGRSISARKRREAQDAGEEQ